MPIPQNSFTPSPKQLCLATILDTGVIACFKDLVVVVVVGATAKALSTLSQKSETVAENGETTAKFGDCRTFLRQCGQALRLRRFKSDRDEM